MTVHKCSNNDISKNIHGKTFFKTPPPPAPRLSPNLHNPLKIFAGLSKHVHVFLLGTENIMGGWVAIVVVVCGKICGKMCNKMCGKIEKLSDWNKNLCGSKYGPHDYDSGSKKTKRQKGKKAKMQKDKKAKRQKDKNTKRQKDKKTKKTKRQKKDKNKKKKKKKKYKNKTNNKDRGPKGPPCPPQELEQGGHRPPKF